MVCKGRVQSLPEGKRMQREHVFIAAETERTIRHDLPTSEGVFYSCSYVPVHLRTGTFALQKVELCHLPRPLAIHSLVHSQTRNMPRVALIGGNVLDTSGVRAFDFPSPTQSRPQLTAILGQSGSISWELLFDWWEMTL